MKRAKNIKNIIRQYIQAALIIILTALIVLTSSACCIAINEVLKAASEKMEEDAEKEIGEIFDKYNIELKDSTSLDAQDYQDIDYTDIKKELTDKSSYPITPQEEEEFFNNLEQIYDAETYPLVENYFKNFKILYPSGYFTIIKATQIEPGNYFWFTTLEYCSAEDIYDDMVNGLPNVFVDKGFSVSDLNDEYSARINMANEINKALKDEYINENTEIITPDFNDEYSSQIYIALHEMTHSLSGAGLKNYFIKDLDFQYYQDYSYLIGSLIVLVERDKVFFPKFEIFEDIKKPDHFDRTYHEFKETTIRNGEEFKMAYDVDITMMLDELNAYTVNAKCAVATEEFISPKGSCGARHGLLKQMSYLELYLKRCYEKHPEDWKYLTGHKGMTFLIMKLWFEAEKFENALKDDKRFNLDSKPVADFVYEPANYEIIKKLFRESGILEYKDKEFNDIEDEFDSLKIWDINSL